MNFDIKTEQLSETAFVISLAGEVDLYTAPEFKQQLLEVITQGARRVVVDFLTAVSLAGSPYHPVEDPAAAVVFGGSPARVLETVVDGITRYRQGEDAWHEVRSTASAARARLLGR